MWTSEKVHIRENSMKVRSSQKFHRVWNESGPLEDSTLRKYRWKIKLLKSFIEMCTKYEPLINFTLRKYRWKTKLLKGFIENVLSVDLWWIPRWENIDGRSNFSRVHRECTKYEPSKISTLRKYQWKSELIKIFIENVLSVDLWKIPHLENIDERSNFSRVSSRMY